MKKSLIAAAMLGLGAGGAMAQSSVTVYGKIDAGAVLESGAPGGAHRVALTSGVSGGSRLGFKGVEDLGDGLRASFQIETGFCSDSNTAGFCSGGNNFMGRQAHIDLSGGFGSVSLGRQYTPAFIVLATVDPFGTGLAGTITNVTDTAGASGSRANNAAIYNTPTWGGFQFSAMGAAGETTGNWKAGRAIGGSGTYASGPLWVGLGYNKVNTAAGASGKKNWIVGATYDFGVAKGHAMFQTVKDGTASATQSWKDASEYMLGVSTVFGQSTVLASVVGHNDKTAANLDARQVGLGYYYALSKRTSLYAAAAHITNKHGAFHTVGNGTETGTGNQALNLGVVHNF
jgi:predicted porin